MDERPNTDLSKRFRDESLSTDEIDRSVQAVDDLWSDVAEAEKVFQQVWRFDFSAPGFCLVDLGPGIDSTRLRSRMLVFKEQLSNASFRETGKRLVFRSLARFDQQETTKFHLDGAPDQSMLILGYEPSQVRSRLFIADYSRAAFDMKITPQQFLQDFNPMYQRGEDILARYVTELPQPAEGHSRILFINNSSLPFMEARTNSLGVMHKAEIINGTPTERRIVNSMLIAVGETDEISGEQQEEFFRTEKISEKVY